MSTAPTFADLVKLEPKLGELLTEAKSYHTSQNPEFCANAAWYGYGGEPGIKPRLLKLVGWERPGGLHWPLSTPAAYDVAYDTLFEALPDCGKCCPYC